MTVPVTALETLKNIFLILSVTTKASYFQIKLNNCGHIRDHHNPDYQGGSNVLVVSQCYKQVVDIVSEALHVAVQIQGFSPVKLDNRAFITTGRHI